jgi:ATP-dependent helicase HrpA
MASVLQKQNLLTADFIRLRALEQSLGKSNPAAFAQKQEAALARFQKRLESTPKIRYAEGLPVSERAEEIAELIRHHQVVVITGETGSGKTTQLPKICLAAGRGRHGLIGHTQPRRIAARSVAERIAKELGEKIGESVGFKVRFTDNTAPDAFVKLMTDGILLAETQTDRYLNAYDTIIIDEAHERSLNIDFLLGYLRELLPRRPDLKVVITSATIDAQRFAEHFCSASGTPAPLIEVSGRTYPVEIRYRPVNDIHTDDEQEIEDAIADAVDECTIAGPGDILVFLPGEREIRETMEIVRKRLSMRRGGAAQILPLFARLSNEEQQRIFHPEGNQRRVILATNVAETSLTVAGIRFVIDAGLARMSRYATRSKVQLLHIENISQASANQRSGRCGRVGPGIAIRLYSEEDFNARPAFTEPEILRSSLASVILRLAALGFGKIETFPFLEAPSGRAIADGYNELQDLGALDGNSALTAIGKELARLPIEPRLARILIEGKAKGCLSEALVIVAALSVPDPRERPMEAREAADKAHAKFDDDRSDFVALLNVWKFFLNLSGDGDEEKVHHRKQVQLCRESFVNWLRLREWRDIHRQLADTLRDMNWRVDSALAKEVPYENLHRALLSGLAASVGFKDPEGEGYAGPRGINFYVFPGSGVNRKGLKWLMAAELAETTRLFARTVAKVEPEWIEHAAGERVARHVFEPKWDAASAQVVAFERVSLHGLTLIPRRRVAATSLDPALAREIFIREGLVANAYTCGAKWLENNRNLIKKLEELEHRARRLDVVVDEDTQVAFYRARIPLGVASGASFEKWLSAHADPKALEWTEKDVTRAGASAPTEEQFPKQLVVGDAKLAMGYRFEPGHVMDGVTVRVPLALLNTITPAVSTWLVPGLIREKIAALFKQLPKAERGRLQPIPDAVTNFLECVPSGEQALNEAAAAFLKEFYKLDVTAAMMDDKQCADHLRLNVRVMDAEGNELAMGRDVMALQAQLGQAAQAAFSGNDDSLTQTGLTSWTLGTLPENITLKHGKQTVVGYPALVDEGKTVGVKVLDTPEAAAISHRKGLIRLMRIELAQQVRNWEKGPSGFVPIALQFKTAIASDKLLEDFVAALVDRAFLGEDEPPRDERAYKAAVARAKTRLPAVAEGLARTLAAIASEYSALNAALAAPGSAKALVPMLKAWRDDLIFSGFLNATPWSQLGELPRYVKAVARRLAKFQDYPLREQRNAPIIAGYKTRLQQNFDVNASPKHTEFRWLVEELHVSLFAQELKTPFPVSAKRLDKAWSEL